VYSSIKAVHRDAIKLCNNGFSNVFIRHEGELKKPDITLLRNIFKGEIDKKINYVSDNSNVTILKTSIKE
tara:strand:- start:1227 stop:1436 length:210 start_codon:yes stop_codon:yes gene_type:complete